MRALGFPVKKEEVKKIVADYDKSGASRVSYDDFVELSAYLVVAGNIRRLPPPARLTHPPVVAGEAGHRQSLSSLVSLTRRPPPPPSSPSSPSPLQ